MVSASAYRSRLGLMLTTALGSAMLASVAFAQAPATPAGEAENSQQADTGALEEVVVTATRQADTVNRVPLSVTAQTQRNLDQQGIRTVTDLQATVPALQVTQQLGSGVGNFSIRGIVQSAAGAATTGFYLDDTPLQKRNVAGGVGTANGTPIPPLFDLDRIEVLRGPQGTLYGGSSEGGTIRYIQPSPSLTRYSTYVRLQASTPKKGDESYEGGVAIGGPIIQDKLGFRVSAFARRQGGYIDMIDPVTRQEWAHNTGRNDVRVFRAAVTWAPTDRLRITGSYLSSRDKTDNVNTSYTLAPAGAITVPAACFNTAAYNAATPPRGGVPAPVAIGAANCAAATAANPSVFTLPGATYGPYNLDRYDSLAADVSPTKTNLQVASLTFDYDFENMSMKAITSYIDDQNKTVAPETSQLNRYPGGTLANPNGATVIDPVTGQSRVVMAGLNFNQAFAGVPTRFQGGHFVSNNRRYGLTQEVRFQSAANARPLSWVAGVYYSNIRNPQAYDNYYQLAQLGSVLYGFPNSNLGVQQRYGVAGLETAPGLFNNFDARRQSMKDVEIAGFAEANYWVTEKLRLTAGLRVSRVTFENSNLFIGPVTGVGPDNVNPANQVPNAANGGANSGQVSESPVTPKVGLQYNITDNDLVYLTASKGFRAGGINPLPSVGICGNALNVYGLSPTDLPQTYGSDSVWSYEAGAKFRVLENRVQLNGSVYRIDWKNPQVTLSPGFQCGLVSTYNADTARSQGFEVEAQARLFRSLTLNAAVGYNDAKFTSTTIGVVGRATPTNGFVQSNLVIAQDGQKMPIAPWTVNVGGRYDVDLSSNMRGYLRADWRWAKSYDQFQYGIGTFNPDVNRIPSIQNTNVRLGVEYGDFDINLFINNVFDRKKGVMTGGRGGCATPAAGGTAACSTYATYTPFYQINTGYPREIGFQIAYRH
jgi:outer membrane receptor protein involved in Fe transport